MFDGDEVWRCLRFLQKKNERNVAPFFVLHQNFPKAKQ